MHINATIFGQAIAFILFVLFCMKYIWPPLIFAINQRQKEIADGLAFAERAKKDLDAVQVEVNNRLKLAKLEASAIINRADEHGAQVINKSKIKAKLERNKIILQARSEINIERKRVIEELKKHIVTISFAMAEKIIERSIDKTTNSNIIDEFIAKL